MKLKRNLPNINHKFWILAKFERKKIDQQAVVYEAMIATVYKSKQLVSCIQSTQFGQIFMAHLPQTVLRQVLHKSILLLRHFEVANVFRCFSKGSLVSKEFLSAAAFFRAVSPEVVPVSSSTTRCANFLRLTPDLQISRKTIQLLINAKSITL